MAAELPEADQEKMAALRSSVREQRLQREHRAESQRQKDLDLAEAWKRRSEARTARAKEGRREQLERLQASRSPRSNPEDLSDEDYRRLMDKYGGRLRTPRPPPQYGAAQESSVGSTQLPSGVLSSRTVESSVPSVPPVPPPPRKPRVPPAPGPRRVVGYQPPESWQVPPEERPRRLSGATEGGPSPVRRLSIASGSNVATGGALPSVMTSARGLGASGGGIGDHEAQAASITGGPSGAHSSAAEIHEGQAVGPHRSLMPKKDRLRKKQQELLKKTDVVFYRQHMRKHFQRILEACELTFSETAKKKKANMNLSKPLTVTELRHLSPAGVRQP